jgi:hypothetical protein
MSHILTSQDSILVMVVTLKPFFLQITKPKPRVVHVALAVPPAIQ